jgi:large subunit ribosomal protein L4
MPKLDVFNLEKTKVGEVSLSDAVFGAEVREHLFWEVTKAEQASQRAGTRGTKNRSLTAGGGKKPWRQKGTGRARQGSIRAVQWVGGGRAFAIRPHQPDYQVPRKVRRAAMRSALSLRAKEGKLVVVDSLELPAVKTKALASALRKLTGGKTLLVDERNEKAKLSARNLKDAAFVPVDGVGLLDVLRYDHLLLTRKAAEKLDGAYQP